MPQQVNQRDRLLKLSPELKSWIDRVVVPALVHEYLAVREREKSACSDGEPVAEFATTRTATVEEGG